MEGTEYWKVEDIIDQERKMWNKQMIDDLFTETEAELILKIPLSLHSHDDRLIWHYDKKGIFNVKSAYDVARANQRSHTQASSSGHSSRGTESLRVYGKKYGKPISLPRSELLAGDLEINC